MRIVALAVLSLVSALVARTTVSARPLPVWMLPPDREVYLMEDDLVYARFLTLARGGTYRQINRDEQSGEEVDRGKWEQDAAGVLRLHSTCRALRPRALSSGPLSITLTGANAFEDLPRLLVSIRKFLAVNRDTVFGARSISEMCGVGEPAIHVDREAVTFERRNTEVLATRIEAALASERSATYLLEPVKGSPTALFTVPGGTFGAADLAEVRRTYRAAAGAAPPFYFARVEAKTYAAAVGRWQPLHLPAGGQ